MTKKINRRDFLRMSAMTVGGMVLAACASATEAPTGEAPVEEAPVEEAPVEKAAATPTPRPVAEPTNTPVAQVAAAKESPMLADLVAAGTLPPLEERLPKNPLTLNPVNGTGKFGGRLRMASWWQDGGIQAKLYGHSAIRFVDDGLGLAPVCASPGKPTPITPSGPCTSVKV
jgi:peptide/nickel transport system substrate-binding protein